MKVTYGFSNNSYMHSEVTVKGKEASIHETLEFLLEQIYNAKKKKKMFYLDGPLNPTLVNPDHIIFVCQTKEEK